LFPVRNHLGGRTLQVGGYFVFLPHEIVNSLLGLTKATRNLGWKIPLQGVGEARIIKEEEEEECCKRQFFVQIHPKEPGDLECVSITYDFPPTLELSTLDGSDLVTLAFPRVLRTLVRKLALIDLPEYQLKNINGKKVHTFESSEGERKLELENNSMTFSLRKFSSEDPTGFESLKKESLKILEVLLEDMDIQELSKIVMTNQFLKSMPPLEKNLKGFTTESVFLKEEIKTKVKVLAAGGIYSLTVSTVTKDPVNVNNFSTIHSSLSLLHTHMNHFVFLEECGSISLSCHNAGGKAST
jgi:hypothetical protein